MSAFDWKNPDFNLLKDDDENYPIIIKHDGSWWHEGTSIKRHQLVVLFNTVLKYDSEKDEYWLITPAEQGRIQVEDVPYIINDFMVNADNSLSVVTNLGETVIVGKEHPIMLMRDKINGQMLPYVDVKNGLKARFGRAVYYKLVEMSEEKPDGYYIKSGVYQYCIGEIDA